MAPVREVEAITNPWASIIRGKARRINPERQKKSTFTLDIAIFSLNLCMDGVPPSEEKAKADDQRGHQDDHRACRNVKLKREIETKHPRDQTEKSGKEERLFQTSRDDACRHGGQENKGIYQQRTDHPH